jgi:hypothetical protein
MVENKTYHGFIDHDFQKVINHYHCIANKNSIDKNLLNTIFNTEHIPIKKRLHIEFSYYYIGVL